MLIELHKSLMQVDEASIELLRFVGNLAAAYRDGHHEVYAERHVLRWLISLDDLGRDARESLKIVYNSLSRRGAFAETALYRVLAYVGERPPAPPGVFPVEINKLQTMNSLRHAVLLAENLTDCRLLAHLACGHLASQACELIHGGGSTTARVFDEQRAARWVFCVVDSDRVARGAKLGATARAVQRAWRQFEASSDKALPTRLHIWEARELENLLGERLIQYVYPSVHVDPDPYVDLKETLGDQLLENVTSAVGRINPHHLVHHDLPSNAELFEVTRQIAHWCVAPRPRRA